MEHICCYFLPLLILIWRKKNHVAVPFLETILEPNKIWNHFIPRFYPNRTLAWNRSMLLECNHSIPFHLVLEANTP
jgi:hypothetical protein